MENERFDPELDDFLSDLHRLLDDVDRPVEEPPAAESEAEDPEELPEAASAEEPDDLSEEPLPEEAEDPDFDVDELLARAEDAAEEEPAEEPEPEAEPVAEPEPEPVSEEAPKENKKPETPREKAKEVVNWTQKQRVPRHVAKLQKNQEQAYADWLYEQEQRGDDAPPPELLDVPDDNVPTPRKKGHGLRNFVIILVVLALALTTAAAFVLPQQPDKRQELGERKDGVSTILIMGTDDGGARTDSMVLLTVDGPARKLSLVSIPRDTLVPGKYQVPKINSVFGANGGGKDGLEMINIRVGQCIGFVPDGYLMVQLEDFEAFVDLMGGVTFDVPMDMEYDDPAQDLHISLKAGPQTLDGESAMELMRYRSGYPDADLGRIRVQRDFLSALMEQAVSARTVLQLPRFLSLVLRETQTDLSAGNLLWLAKNALLADRSHIQTATLPGTPATINGGSYYVLDPALVAQTVNTYCNPYVQEVTPADLEIEAG